MEYYLYAIIDVLSKYYFELINISIGLSLLAWMDFIHFQRSEDSGYFSIHTKGSKRDAWHDGKKLAILFFGVAAIGEKELVYIVNNAYIWLAFLAWFIQWFIYHGVLKTIKRIFRISKTNKE